MRHKNVLTIGMGLLISVSMADAASAYYSPRLGRFLNRDPISEPGAVLVRQAARPATSFIPRDPAPAGRVFLKDGPWLSWRGLRPASRDLNDYGFVRGNPVDFVDPLGLITWARTGVFHCKGYNKKDLVWDTISSHTYVRIDGIGYGFYSKSWETGDGSSGKALYDDGVIVSNDHERYPERNSAGIKDGETYAICAEVEVSTCCYDAGKVKGYVLDRIKQGIRAQENSDPTTYSVVGGSCTWWAKTMIQDGLVRARRSTWGCAFQTIWYGPRYLARPPEIW